MFLHLYLDSLSRFLDDVDPSYDQINLRQQY